MKHLTLKEIEKDFGLPVRLLSYLIRNDIIAPVVREGKLLIPDAELQKYLALPKAIRKNYVTSYLKTLGPGLITGAADDDPSGIATYSTVGSTYGLSLTWLSAYLLPMMSAIQETVARIGIVTGKGLAKALGKHYGQKILYPLILMLLVTNTINIGADIGAMVASAQLIYPINFTLGAIILTLFMLFLEIKFSYHRYSKILKWLTLSLFAYIATGFIIRPDWFEVARSIAIPKIEFNTGFLTALVAVMGTTISPYLFFWQASEEVEDKKDKGRNLEHHIIATRHEIKEMRKDTFIGMSYANIVFLFIIITTAFVLHKNGIVSINTAAEAAAALAPLAGRWASLLFTLGIFGVGLLAVPVLASSSAYALTELFKWHEGISKRYSQAKGFYGVIIWSMILGLAMNFIGLNPIRALYYSAVLNGIASPILMTFIFLLGRRKDVMGEFTNPRWVNIWGIIGTTLMGISAILLVAFLILGI